MDRRLLALAHHLDFDRIRSLADRIRSLVGRIRSLVGRIRSLEDLDLGRTHSLIRFLWSLSLALSTPFGLLTQYLPRAPRRVRPVV